MTVHDSSAMFSRFYVINTNKLLNLSDVLALPFISFALQMHDFCKMILII